MDKYEIIALVMIAVFAVPVLYLLVFIGRIILAGISDYKNRDQMKKEVDCFQQMCEAVKAIPLNDAKEEVKFLFLQPEAFKLASPSDTTPISNLSNELQDFFAVYGEITAKDDEAIICRKEIQPYKRDKSFIWLGQDGEHTHLVAKPNEDAVYIVADDVPKAQQIEDQFPSIFHYIVFVNRRSQG